MAELWRELRAKGLRRCCFCGQVKLRSAYDGRARRCRECTADVEGRAEHRRAYRRQWQRAYVRRQPKRCWKCGAMRPREEYRPPKPSLCAKCREATLEGRRERERERARRRRRTPEGAASLRAASARYKAKVYADPVALLRYRETARLAYHLRREREGRPACRTLPVQQPPETPIMLSAAPLVDFIVDWLERVELSEAVGLPMLGFDNRALRRWRAQAHVSIATADAVLTRAGARLADVYPADDHPMLYAA